MKFDVATRPKFDDDDPIQTVVVADYISVDAHGSLVLANQDGFGGQIVAVFHASQWISCRQRETVAIPLAG